MLKFYKVNNKVVYSNHDLGEEVIPLKEDAGEKHVPVFRASGDKLRVKVGSNPHPMLDNHYIEYVVVETNFNIYAHYFKPGDEAEVSFKLKGKEKVKAVYAYCNIHGLYVSTKE